MSRRSRGTYRIRTGRAPRADHDAAGTTYRPPPSHQRRYLHIDTFEDYRAALSLGAHVDLADRDRLYISGQDWSPFRAWL